MNKFTKRSASGQQELDTPFGEKPIRPQPSERWAMYRLICPVTDAALEISGLEAFYEYSQPNGPNKRLSADIAIVQGSRPVWLIEAKKFARKLHPGLIDCYLRPGMMGVVTNGNHWIFLVRGKHVLYGPMVRPDGRVDAVVRARVTRMLACISEDEAFGLDDGWREDWRGIAAVESPRIWYMNKATGSREFAEKLLFDTLGDAARAALKHAKHGTSTAMLLEALLAAEMEIRGGSVEVSKNRLIWVLPGLGRGARVDLASRQLDMLVHNTLIDAVGRETISASIKLHDKNHHMSVCKASTPQEVSSLVPVFGVMPV
ncbi:Uncharacterised protein [Achromobacter xylosoxidans]|nr:hypothetical protein [Achromobacter xylosoxidans]CUI84399.1 Uncharacterised protein [Achromobacter xylosoxidans]CUJ97513.1 Uncharacterised protein [Achromobacter xylosoxidans]CUR66144.1 hypothetical protein BN2877_15470 [Achromobacter xylosoxidans]